MKSLIRKSDELAVARATSLRKKSLIRNENEPLPPARYGNSLYIFLKKRYFLV
jgi:hypothetical protein